MDNPPVLDSGTSEIVTTAGGAEGNIDSNIGNQKGISSEIATEPPLSVILNVQIITKNVESDDDTASSWDVSTASSSELCTSSNDEEAAFNEEEVLSMCGEEEEVLSGEEEVLFVEEEESGSSEEGESGSGEEEESGSGEEEEEEESGSGEEEEESGSGEEEEESGSGEEEESGSGEEEESGSGEEEESGSGEEEQNGSGEEEEASESDGKGGGSGREEKNVSGEEGDSGSCGEGKSISGGEGKSISGGEGESVSGGVDKSGSSCEEMRNKLGKEQKNESCEERKNGSNVEAYSISLSGGRDKGESKAITELRDIFFESEDFVCIVNSGAFIDRTLFIRKLFHKPSYKYMKTLLLTAPHQSGKSVNMNMVKRFLEIKVDQSGKQKISVEWSSNINMWLENDDMTENFKLFKEINLKIFQCLCTSKHTIYEMKTGNCPFRHFFYENCGQHPVVFVSFHGLDCYSWDDLLSSYRSLLNKLFRQFQYLEYSEKLSYYEKSDFEEFVNGEKSILLNETQLTHGLEILVSCLRKHFEKKVVVLIDNFDAPIMELMQLKKKGDRIERELKFITKIIVTLMKGNENLMGGLINANKVLSMCLLEYANIADKCAFLENEYFSEFYRLTKQDARELLKRPEFKDFTEENILEYYNGDTGVEDNVKVCEVHFLMEYLENWMP